MASEMTGVKVTQESCWKYVGNDGIDLSMAAVRISRQMSLQLKDMKELQSWSEISAEA